MGAKAVSGIIGGPAQLVVTSSEAPAAGPAQPVAVITSPLYTLAGPPLKVVAVSDNRARMGGPAIPVVVATGAAAATLAAGPPIPVYVVSGSLGGINPLDLTWRMWLTGATFGADASAIATWDDEAGTNDATQGTAGNRPSVDSDGLNGKPCAVFAGTDFMDAPNITPTGATSAGSYSKFAVFLLDTIAGQSNNLLSGTTSGHFWRINDSAGAGQVRMGHGATGTNITSPTLATATVYIGLVTYDAVLDRFNAYLDGAWIGTLQGAGANSDPQLNVGAFVDASTLQGRGAVFGIRQGVLSGDNQYTLHQWAIDQQGYKSVASSLDRVIGIGGSWMEGRGVTGQGTTGGDTLMGQTFALLSLSPGSNITAQNSGVFGQTTAQLLTATTVYSFYSARAEDRVCIYWVTGNDLDAGTAPATVWANVQTEIQRVIGCGYSVLVLPVLPRSSANGNYETDRGTLNASISGGVGALGATYVNIFAGGGSVLNNPAVIANTTYYQVDQIHITAAAYALISANLAAPLQAVL